MPGPDFDQTKAEAFADKLMGILNGGSLALMISIGHRTGLFDAMAGLPPSTPGEIAETAGLNDRYVREWLGAMLTGGLVDCDGEGTRFSLPPEHAAFLTRAATPENIAAFAQYIAVLGSVEDRIVECFKHGGGVPYAEFPRFQEVMAEDSGQTVVPAIIDAILPLAPGLVERMEAGIDVLDVGCGSGRALHVMAVHFKNSRFTGYDFSGEGVAAAQANARAKGLDNLKFEVKDVTRIGISAGFDLVTAFDAIHDQADPASVLGSIAEALRPDGTFLMQDIDASSEMHKNLDHPAGPFLYTISCMH